MGPPRLTPTTILKPTSPPTVVGVSVVEDDGDVIVDVHHMNDEGRGWLRSGTIVFAVVGARGVGRGVSHGCGSRGNRGGRGG
jgi:hypothetical protein